MTYARLIEKHMRMYMFNSWFFFEKYLTVDFPLHSFRAHSETWVDWQLEFVASVAYALAYQDSAGLEKRTQWSNDEHVSIDPLRIQAP